jgi:hypothetical protein
VITERLADPVYRREWRSAATIGSPDMGAERGDPRAAPLGSARPALRDGWDLFLPCAASAPFVLSDSSTEHTFRCRDRLPGLVHRHVRKKFILVLDRHSAHRKAIRLLQEQHPDWMEVVWLPAYAPELNPVERVWNHSQYGDLANFLPEGIDHLREAVSASLERMGTETALLLSCFRYTGLEW